MNLSWFCPSSDKAFSFKWLQRLQSGKKSGPLFKEDRVVKASKTQKKEEIEDAQSLRQSCDATSLRQSCDATHKDANNENDKDETVKNESEEKSTNQTKKQAVRILNLQRKLAMKVAQKIFHLFD